MAQTVCLFYSIRKRTDRPSSTCCSRASAHPGRAAHWLCSELPRLSRCGGPEAARTCGAQGNGPSSGLCVPGITNATQLATHWADREGSWLLSLEVRGKYEAGKDHRCAQPHWPQGMGPFIQPKYPHHYVRTAVKPSGWRWL